jgi:hypothetical protein
VWQAMLAVGVAMTGFLGVVIGAVVTGFVTLRQAQLATEREHQIRQIEWAQARKDAHDAFQRENLLALQDAIEDVRRATMRDHDRKLKIALEEGFWDKGSIPDPWTNRRSVSMLE